MQHATVGFILGLVVGRFRAAPELDWDEAVSTSLRYRLGGRAWTLAAADATVPDFARQAWEGAYRSQALCADLLLDELAALRSTLARVGVVPGVVKGVQLLESGVHRPGSRAVDDVDLVVPARAVPVVIQALVEAGWTPWSRDPIGESTWAPAAAFEARGSGRCLGLSVDVHWDMDYSVLRSHGRDGVGLAFDPRGWLRAENHLVLVIEHVLKHLRFRTHLVGLTDAVSLAAGVDDWDRVLRGLRRSAWCEAALALLEGLGDELQARVIPRGALPRARPELRRRLDPRALIAAAGSPPGRLIGIGARFRYLGLRRSLRDFTGALVPPAAWLRTRYGRGSALGRRVRHLGRLVEWGLGAGPSPFAPNPGDS